MCELWSSLVGGSVAYFKLECLAKFKNARCAKAHFHQSCKAFKLSYLSYLNNWSKQKKKKECVWDSVCALGWVHVPLGSWCVGWPLASVKLDSSSLLWASDSVPVTIHAPSKQQDRDHSVAIKSTTADEQVSQLQECTSETKTLFMMSKIADAAKKADTLCWYHQRFMSVVTLDCNDDLKARPTVSSWTAKKRFKLHSRDIQHIVQVRQGRSKVRGCGERKVCLS